MDVKKRSLAGALAIFWLVAITAGYYVSHKPAAGEQVLALVSIVQSLTGAVLVLSLAGGIGRLLLPASELRPLVQMSLQAALGLGMLAILTLAVGAAAGLSILGIWAAILAGLALLFRPVLNWWAGWADLIGLWRQAGRLGRLIAALTAFLFLMALLIALAPPVKYDALVYHLALPQAYLRLGRLAFIPGNVFWGMPESGEMLFTLALGLGGLPAAAVLGWGFGLLAVLGLAAYAADRLGNTEAWVAIAALLSGLTLSQALEWAYVDWLALLFGCSCLVALDLFFSRARQEPDPGRFPLILAGTFAGMALGTKYTAGVLLLAGLASLAVLRLPGVTGWKWVARLGLFALPAVLVSLPWWIKNGLATGNPFYPLLFPAGEMDRLRLDLYQGARWGSWPDVLFLPLRATFSGIEGGPVFSASIGPLLLGLAPAACLAWRERRDAQRDTLRIAAMISLAGLATWMLAGTLAGYLLQTRLYLAIFPALALLAGAGYGALARCSLPGVRLGRVAGALLLLVLGLNGLQSGLELARLNPFPVVAGFTDRQKYLEDNLGWYARAAQTLRALPPGSKVLMLWEPRSLYCAPVCIPDEIIDRWLHDLRTSGTAQAVLDRWRQQGISHLLVYHLGADLVRHEYPGYRPEDWQALDSLLQQLPPPANFGNAYSLYAITP